MGSYKELKGDLLALAKSGQFDIICQGCNCQKIMGSGIAKQIREQFPEAYKVDRDDIRNALQRYGDLSHTYIGNHGNCHVLNLYTQYMPGPYFNIIAFESSLLKLKLILEKDQKIGLPQIGAGIGGGDWEEIKLVIQRVLSEYDVTVVIYDK